MAAIAKANDAQWLSSRPAAPAKRSRSLASRSTARYCRADAMQGRFRFAANGQLEMGDQVRRLPLHGRQERRLRWICFLEMKTRLNQRFPHVVEALQQLPGGTLTIDGELVALDEPRSPVVPAPCKTTMPRIRTRCLYAFDLLHSDGDDLTNLSLRERRHRLEELMRHARDPIRLSPLLPGSAAEVARAVQKLGLEGVVGKREDSVLRDGRAVAGAWVKYRTDCAQEFVIGGYTPGGKTFDSLLVGVYDGRDLIFTAKVKDGFVPRVREEIFRQMKALAGGSCPFVNLPETKGRRWGDAVTKEKMKECRWLKPKLVCQVGFVEWTDAGHLRHAKFIAMRDDKAAKDVVRESD